VCLYQPFSHFGHNPRDAQQPQQYACLLLLLVVVLSAVRFIPFVYTLNNIKKYTQGHYNSVDSVSFWWWLDAF